MSYKPSKTMPDGLDGPSAFGHHHRSTVNTSAHPPAQHPNQMLWRQGPYDTSHVDNHVNHEGGRRGWIVPKSFDATDAHKNYHVGGHVLPDKGHL
jgi:hypothetical protein